ncbi:MAG: sulfotransferase domain-containing protein [Myxococcales bacterium]|nr:sulfotransferase domain-containing protein [Myxococcales bacterium]
MNGMLIVIGAMKCGTSTLHQHLRLHPQISMSRVKELDFFVSERTWPKGVEWYRSRFDARAAVRGESSPNYTKWPKFDGVPARMHSVAPDAKLVYLMRDPIDRIVSHYRHNVSHGRETRPVDVALTEPGPNNYVTSSSYWLQISKFLEFYAPEQLRLFELRELNSEPRRVVRELCEWVGVDAAFDHAGLDRIHHSSSDKGRPTELGRRIQEYPGGRAVRTVLSRWLEEPLPKPVLALETREYLREQLAPDVAALREFWGRDLADWSV